MEIQEQDGVFLVIENGETLYSALTLEEAQGYIDWVNRGDNAGNTPEDCGCN